MILRRVVSAGIGAALAVTTGCGFSAPDRRAEFSALVTEIEGMPGVSWVRNTYANGFSQGRDLRLAVLVEEDATVAQLATVSDLLRDRSDDGEFDGFTRRMEFALPESSPTYSHLSRFRVGWDGWRPGYDDPAACWLELTHLHRGLVVDTVSGSVSGSGSGSGGGAVLDVYLPIGSTSAAGPAGPDTVTAEQAVSRCLAVGGPGGGFSIRFRLDGPDLVLSGSAPDADRVLDLHRRLGSDHRPYVVNEMRMDGVELTAVTVAAAPGRPAPDARAVARELGAEVRAPHLRATVSASG